MRALVVYDSKFGNTRKVAEAIAAGLGGGEGVRLKRAEEVTNQDVAGLDLLVVGSPTYRWQPTPAMHVFLQRMPARALAGMRAAAFDTGYEMRFSGSAAKKIEKALARKGCRIVTPATRFYVNAQDGPLAPGQVEKAAAWGQEMARKAGVR